MESDEHKAIIRLTNMGDSTAAEKELILWLKSMKWLDGSLININIQKTLIEDITLFNFLQDNWNHSQQVIDKGTPDFTGSLGTYFREIFFHTPFLIANHLNSRKKFADAQRWYHFIFDPTANLTESEIEEAKNLEDPKERKRVMARRVWQFIEFRNYSLANWREQLNNQQAIGAYKNAPFNPHALEHLRPEADMKSITKKYIDNLIDWVDHLFAQDTMESINEATLLYIAASEILGEHPTELGDRDQKTEDHTYDRKAYCDRVEDRLFKIRNCMNINGLRSQLALFAPEIDPRLLVRVKEMGLSLEDVLNSINGDIPPYRFAFLLEKAKEYAGALQGFGSELLSALEKKDGEELAMLSMRQEDEVLKVCSFKLRDMEVDTADASLKGLIKRQKSIQDRVKYYDNLICEVNDSEEAQDVSFYTGQGRKASAVPFSMIATVAALPSGVLGLSVATPNKSIKKSTEIWSHMFKEAGELNMMASNKIGKQAAYHRMQQGWKFSLQQSKNELKEIESSLVAAEIRRDIAIKSRELHKKSIEQHQETYKYYRDKFTNHGLYTYLSSQLQRMYRESYQDAMSLAKMAEQAYRFERNDETSVLLQGSYWDASQAGLMAGEKLTNDLRRMDLSYMETNTRSMEVDQAFSLNQIDPAALIDLKVKGSCEFTVPEFYFDLFYPGQYRRQIKSARLTIPCITASDSNVSAVMTLKGSYIRKDAKLDTMNGSGLTLIPPSRFISVATCTAQNDSGMFKLDFRDERYMPFEGAGAVESTWQIELPKTLRPFDYSTINDLILHISYTAEYSTELSGEVEAGTKNLESIISSEGFNLPRVFSLRQEFSQAYHQLLHSAKETPVSLELSEKHFPLFLQGRQIAIESAKLIITLDERGFINDSVDEMPKMLSLELEVEANGATSEVMQNWQKDESNNIFENTISPTVFAPFFPSSTLLILNLNINSSGNLAPFDSVPSDPSAIDDHRIKDIYLLLNYRVDTP